MCTWEPRANLVKYGCQELLDEFEEGLKPEAYFCYLTKSVINKQINDVDIKITTIARGVSVGNELEYTDEVTLGRSILKRIPFENLNFL